MEKILLKLLNLIHTSTPCSYGLINNVDAYSKEYLYSTLHQEPEITLRETLEITERMCECSGNSVIEGGKIRKMTDEDIKDLQNII